MIAKKKMMSVIFAVLILLTSSTAAYAVVPKALMDVQPFWVNTAAMTVVLSITNGKAVLSASVEAYSGTTKITAVAVLERLNSDGTYTEQERWDNISSDNRDLDWTSTRYVTKGYTYRFTFTPTITRNGVSETVSGSKSAAG